MSIFKKNTAVEETQEFSGYSVLSSGVYKAIIKQAYVTMAPNKEAGSYNLYFNWKLDIQDVGERSFSKIFFAKVVNAPAKLTFSQLEADTTQAQVLYYHTDDKGKMKEYPAFGSLRRHLDTLIEKSIFDKGVLKEKIVPVYNFQTKKDEPTTVLFIEDVAGMEAALGIMEVHKNGFKDPSKVAKSNDIERVWRLVNGQPFNAEEIRAGVTEPQNCLSWKESWTGKVNDRELDKNKLNGGTSSKGTQALDIG